MEKSFEIVVRHLVRFQQRVGARAENAYSDYIGLLRRDECLGWQIKVERQEFGEDEIKAHWEAAEKLGRHRALMEMFRDIDNVLKEIRVSGALGVGD